MQNDAKQPIDELALCRNLIAEQAATLEKQQREIERLQYRIDLLLRQRYGKKRDKIIPEGMQYLFDIDPEKADFLPEKPLEPTIEIKPYSRRKRGGGGRMTLPAHLERRPIEHDVPESDRTCTCCGKAYKQIGREVTEQLDYEPGSCFVNEHITLKYAADCDCPQCKPVVRAEKPIQPIDKGLPGPGLMAIVAINKHSDHLPLYRQSKQVFAREKITIPESSLCRWMGELADLTLPLYALMKSLVLQSFCINTDDSPVKVQTKPDGMKTGYFWPYVGDAEHPYTVYDFTMHHSRAGPKDFLGDYAGYLQCDAAPVYDQLFDPPREIPHPTEVGCWAHARRKFTDAQMADVNRAVWAASRIGLLYSVEQEAKLLSAEQRYALRQEKTIPVLDSFFAWCKEQLAGVPSSPVLPKSPMGLAIGYALRNEAALRRYCEDGRLAIDNNAAENALRGVAIGRKNWLFAGSPRGGRTAAVLFTLLAGAKRHELEPWRYLRDVIVRLTDLGPGQLVSLLPDHWKAANLGVAAAS